MPISLLDYKLQIKDYIRHNSKKVINFKIVLGIFPIVFGAYKALYDKYHYQTISTLIQKNLPGMCIEPVKTSWQTFDQIFSDQLKFETLIIPNFNKNASQGCFAEVFIKSGQETVPGTCNQTVLRSKQAENNSKLNFSVDSCINKVDFYSNFITINTNENWNKKQNKLFVGCFNKFNTNQVFQKKANTNVEPCFSDRLRSDKSTSKSAWNQSSGFLTYPQSGVGNNWYTISAKKLNNNFFLKNSLNIDELPVKLNSFSNKFEKISQNTLVNNPLISDSQSLSLLRLTKPDNSIKNQFIQFSLLPSQASFWEANPRDQALPVSQAKQILSNKIKFYNSNKNFFFIKNEKIGKLKKIEILQKTQFNRKLILNLKGKISIKKNKQNFTFLKKVENSSLFFLLNSTETAFFLNTTNTKNIVLQNLLKEYALRWNVNLLTDYTRLHKNQNITSLKLKEKSLDLFSRELYNIINTENFLPWISDKKNSFHILKLIQHTIPIDNNEIIPRIMSGYQIPDISNKHALSELKNFNNKLLNIEVAKNYLSCINFFKFKINKLNFKFLSAPISYYNPIALPKALPKEEESKKYLGPSITSNKQLNEISVGDNSQEKSKKWIKQLLYSDNPLTDRQENFFGKSTFFTFNFSLNSDSSTKINQLEQKIQNSKQPLLVLKNNNFTKEIKQISDESLQLEIKSPLLKKSKSKKFFIAPSFSKDSKTKKLQHSEPTKSTSKLFSKNVSSYIIYLTEPEWDIYLKTLQKNNKFKNLLFKLINTNQNNKSLQYNFYPIKNISQLRNLFITWPINQLDESEIFNFVNNVSFNKLKFNKNYINLSDNTVSLTAKQFEKKEYLTGLLEKKQFIQNKSALTKINYHYFPYSQNLLKDSRFKKFSCNQIYKRNATIYQNHNVSASFFNNSVITNSSNNKNLPNILKKLFNESSEPITFNSWLFLAQFSIAFFLLSMFQNILQKYQQEINYVISNLLENNDSSSGESNSDENDKRNSFRIIKNISKNFDNIAGIDVILPELSEIIWFLRNSNYSFNNIKNPISEKILLTGPPGTGKTLLVQAIAGEAEVPVLIESGSSLNQPGTSLNGSEKLKNLFVQAREMSPCIVFIDEIDSFGEARSAMMENPILNNPILDSIYPSNQNRNNLSNSHIFIPNLKFTETLNKSNVELENVNSQDFKIGNQSFPDEFSFFSNEPTKINNENKAKQQKSHLLMQFLIELDGVRTEKKILIFGATNRPQILDSALTRPGRFNKTLDLKLPNKQKRIEILKLYSKKLGIQKDICWTYIGNLTIGLSAADLASAINQSSIKAIQTETIHTIETIEYGIESISGYSSQKNRLKSFATKSKNYTTSFQRKKTSLLDKISKTSIKQIGNNTAQQQKKLFVNRLAFYQAGKLVVQTLLKKHPNVILITLWPELKSQRYHLMTNILEKEFSQIYRRAELESRIIGFYGGKAGEFLNLFSIDQTNNSKMFIKNTFHLNQSDLGMQDISFASWLTELMVNNWYFYSKKISVQNFNQIEENSNVKHIENHATLDFLEKKSNVTKIETNKNKYSIKENSQNWLTKPWLQKQIVKKLEYSYSHKNQWYKIYGNDHEHSENTMYLLPDTYYHTNLHLNNLNCYKFQPTKIILHNKYINCSEKLFWKPMYSKKASISFKKINLTSKKTFKTIINWNDISNLNRDYIYHNLLLTCFNKAIFILNENRELLDLFANYLIQKEIIREYDILKIIREFYKNSFDDLSLSKTEVYKKSFIKKLNTQNLSKTVYKKLILQNNENNTKNNFLYIQESWGKNSRKNKLRFINFSTLYSKV